MRKTQQRLLTALAVPTLATALLIGSASPADALSVNVSLGGAPSALDAPASAHSASTLTGNPTAASHRTTLSLGRPVSAQTGGIDTPAVTASVGADGTAAQSGNVAGAADVSATVLLQNAGNAAVVGGGSLDGSNVDSDLHAALNLGSQFAGDGQTGPGAGSSSPSSGTAAGSTAGNAGDGSVSGSGSGSASGSAGQSGASGSGSSNGSVTPGSSTPGTTQNPVVNVPCTSNELLDALVTITTDGTAQAVDAANQAASNVNGTVVAKPRVDLCTVSLSLDGAGALNVGSASSNPLEGLAIGDVPGDLGGTGGISVVDIDTDQTADGLSVDVNADDSDQTPLLSVK
jgi:hypothetical protein